MSILYARIIDDELKALKDSKKYIKSGTTTWYMVCGAVDALVYLKSRIKHEIGE